MHKSQLNKKSQFKSHNAIFLAKNQNISRDYSQGQKYKLKFNKIIKNKKIKQRNWDYVSNLNFQLNNIVRFQIKVEKKNK